MLEYGQYGESVVKKKAALLAVGASLFLGASADAQGLIGASPERMDPTQYEAQLRRLAHRLELERAKLFQPTFGDLKARTEYGSVIWELANTYESLKSWQNALSAYNNLADLKLPANAVSNCRSCLIQADDKILSIDKARLQSKVTAVENVEHLKFSRDKRLPVPAWTEKEQREYALISKIQPLSHGQVMTLKDFVGN
jgi:hypothetical protein